MQQTVLATLVTVAAISSVVNVRFVRLPSSIGLCLLTFFLSMSIAFVARVGIFDVNFVKECIVAMQFNEALLHFMLSVLLFAGSMHINVSDLAKHKHMIFLLATVSVLISTFIVGLSTWAVFNISLYIVTLISHYLVSFSSLQEFLNIDLIWCLVFGALISPTDPIAVLEILKTLKVPRSLEMKLAGEALFNDGMGIVLFGVLLHYAIGGFDGASGGYFVFSVIIELIRSGLGGIMAGLFLGYATISLLSNINSFKEEILMHWAIVTGGFTFCEEILHVSGVIAVAVAGLFIGAHMSSSSKNQDNNQLIKAFWQMCDELFNAILFVMIGFSVLHLYSIDGAVILISFIIIGLVLVSRLISVAVPIMFLSFFRRRNPNVLWLMTWGGLRGGVSIALALSLPQVPARELILTLTYCVVMFSIVIQGITLAPMIQMFHRNSLLSRKKTSDNNLFPAENFLPKKLTKDTSDDKSVLS